MVRASVDPQTKLYFRFIGATNECPQHPFGGVALVGATAVEYLRNGRMRPEQLLDQVLDGSPKRDLVAITAAIHHLLGASRATNVMLNKSVPFAYDLVTNGIISTAVEFDKGKQGTILPTIDIPDQEQRERFISLTALPRSRRLARIGMALSAALPRSRRLAKIGMAFSDASMLLMPDSPAQPFLDEYQGNILDIAQCYEETPEDPRRMQQLNEARTALSGRLRGPLLLNMSPYLDADTRDVVVGNLLRHTPSEALLYKHFGQPQA